jgi:hypothetical protein
MQPQDPLKRLDSLIVFGLVHIHERANGSIDELLNGGREVGILKTLA